MAITSRRGKPESPSEWTNRLTRNKSPSEPMSAPVFNTKRTVDCTFQSKKQIANLVCDICLVFRNLMIAFNLGMDLNIFILFFKHCEKLFCYQVGYFYMWIFEGLGVCIKECLNFYLHAMQCSMNFTKSQSQRCLFGTWCYFYLCLYASNNLPPRFLSSLQWNRAMVLHWFMMMFVHLYNALYSICEQY